MRRHCSPYDQRRFGIFTVVNVGGNEVVVKSNSVRLLVIALLTPDDHSGRVRIIRR